VMCYCSMNSVVIPTEVSIALHSRYLTEVK
jgi:hypothetical protein